MKQYIKKPWSLNDTKELAILYYMGATNQEISQILNRTELSIKKRLKRANIKPLLCQTYSMKPKRYFPQKCSVENIKTTLHCFKQKKSTILNYTIDDLVIKLQSLFDIEKKLKLQKRYTSQQINQQNHLGLWVSGIGLKQFLHKHGVPVQNSSIYSLKERGYKYIMDGHPANISKLLTKANDIANHQKLPKIYLKGVTDYAKYVM